MLNELLLKEDTIVAISTALKNAPIGIIRISGNKAFNIISKIFKPKNNKKIDFNKGYRIYYGYIIDDNEKVIDEVLISIFKSPYSYTGEDMVEISAHGNMIILNKIVELIKSKGARLAKGGEFSLRAVLNSKMDLTKAFAIKEIIEANTEKQLEIAFSNLNGKLSNKINEIKDKLSYWIPWIEALIDFPEEDIPPIDYNLLIQDLINIKKDIIKILQNYERLRIYKDGIDTVIIGKPNVGKSTFFNYLYGQERVITSEIPGTTRDIISEYINFNGFLLKIYDTAGFRKTQDKIEEIGIKKALQLIKNAKLVFFLTEIDSIDQNDKELLKNLNQNQYLISIINKIDKIEKEKLDESINNNKVLIKNILNDLGFKNYRIIFVSLKEQLNLEQINQALNDFFENDQNLEDNFYITDNFQKELLEDILNYIDKAIIEYQDNNPVELVLVNLRIALEKILNLLGVNLTEFVIDNMLNRFCIGK
ncbi:MAG: tRNA uridine-5-carboxymethylaminomethyl(34) synthesis GTPase MnmE [bacterium]|nr:tRNA uridine-5-carboxymethylaminomethyl(34) synthesis GTPase MnmE [bacterium]